MLNDIHASVYQAAALSRLGKTTIIAAPIPAPVDNPQDPYWSQPHPAENGVDGTCPCGADDDDQIHDITLIMPTQDTDIDQEDQTHDFQDDGTGLCVICGLPADDPIHDVTQQEDGPGVDSDYYDYALLSHGWDDPENGSGLCVVCQNDILADVHSENAPITAAAEGSSGVRFKIPVLIPGNKVETGDGRSFALGALTVRDTPLALKWQIMSSQGHDQSVVVGRIDHVELLGDGGVGNVSGVFDTGKYAMECVRQIRGGMLRGVSADLDKFDANVLSSPEPNRITAQKIEVNEARLSAATIVSISAFAEAYIELVDAEDDAMPDGDYTEETPEMIAASAIVASVPVEPPTTWFDNPQLDKPTHLTILDDGRVFGHIAAWQTNHIGLPYGTRPPRSSSNYAYFRTGALRTAEGSDIRVGQISLSGGHAPLSHNAQMAVEHYDNTNSAMCDLAAGEDKHGIWVAGALRPGVSPERLRAFRASSPSGDWRPINGKLELVAVCAVNVPGFPIAQARVASGAVVALVAAGMAPLVEEKTTHTKISYTEDSLRLAMQEQIDLDRKAQFALERLAPAREARNQALTAAAESALNRIAARRAELDAQAEQLVARVASLHYTPPFKEEKHPRDKNGKFRAILAHLTDTISKHDGPATAQEQSAVNALTKAADAEDRGDNKGASSAANDAEKALDSAGHPDIAKAANAAKATLHDITTKPHDDSTPQTFQQQPQEIQAILEAIATKVGDPEIEKFVKGEGTLSPKEIVTLVQKFLRLLIPGNLSPITKT